MNAVERQSGFVLVSSIWLTLIMLALAGLFGVYASGQLDKAVESKSRITLALDEIATKNTLLYAFSVGSAHRGGLSIKGQDASDIRLDGVDHQGLGGTLFQAQDFAGLIGLNTMNNYHLDNVLQTFESSGLKRRVLTDALYDYIDINERPRLNGREAPAYRVAAMALPTNDYLRSPVELKRVFGWQSWLSEHPDFELENWFSTNWRSRVNINTVPEDLLVRLLPVNEKDQRMLIERRAKKPFANMADVNSVLNIRATLDEDYYTFLPGSTYRIRFYSANNRKISTMIVRFSPLSTRTPWEVHYRYESERNFDIAESVRIVPGGYFDWELSAAGR